MASDCYRRVYVSFAHFLLYFRPLRTQLFIIHGVQRRMISVVIFFRIFEIIIFCFVVAICDLVHDVETIVHISFVLTASGNLF